MSEQTTTTDTEIRAPIHAAIPDGEVDGGFEHINRIEAMRNRLAAGSKYFTLDELKLTLAWADHLNYFRSLDMPRLTALEAEKAALEAEVAEARAKAIEECAKVADKAVEPDWDFDVEDGSNGTARSIALAIRSQGEQGR